MSNVIRLPLPRAAGITLAEKQEIAAAMARQALAAAAVETVAGGPGPEAADAEEAAAAAVLDLTLALGQRIGLNAAFRIEGDIRQALWAWLARRERAQREALGQL